MKNYKCDIAIVGSGPAGMAAAVEAAATGLDVIVFEKCGRTGGEREGGIGPMAVGSFLQEQDNVEFTKADGFEFMMTHGRWKTNARLVSEYINQSSDTIDWLAAMGLKFTNTASYYKGGARVLHNFDFRSGVKITDVLRQKGDEEKVRYILNCPAASIIMKDGKAAGVSGTDGNGEEFTAEAKAVIVCTGGFAGDPELVYAQGYTKDVDIFYTFEMKELCGDGLRMLWNAGAAKGNMMMDTYIGLTKGYGGPMGTAPRLAALRQFHNIFVDQKGHRFMREDLLRNPAYAGNAVHAQYKGCAIAILDQGLYEDFLVQDAQEAKRRPPMPAPKPGQKMEPFERFTGTMEEIMQEAIDSGVKDFFIADSLEDFARQAGLPIEELRETIDEYNAMCDAKEDNIFHKDRQFLKKITGPRYYGARFFCDTYGGLGGVNIDYRARVLNDDKDPIPGLYAAGNDANTIFGDTYPFYMAGNTSSFALNTGRMAGKDAVKYVTRLKAEK